MTDIFISAKPPEPLKRPRIWFNKSLSSTSHTIETIREVAAGRPGEDFFFVCTHTSETATVAPLADYFEIEPTGLGSAGYVNWCLDFVRRQQIDVFIPRNYAHAIAASAQRFADVGVKLILAADAPTLELIKHKGRFYDALGADLVPQPAFRVVACAGQFAASFAELTAHHDRVCIKPAEGIGGKGFRIITTNGAAPIFSTWDNKQLSIDYDEALADFSSEDEFPELMMMEFLPGQERSVDCVAVDGKLLAAVVRLKSYDGVEELLEDNPLLVEYSRRVTARAGLTGLYNVQFMEAGGVQYLLEVNARMSGGIHYSALSGVCLPYWAIRLALGTACAEDIPEPRTGIRVERKTRRVLGTI
jgi:hypothetical protein